MMRGISALIWCAPLLAQTGVDEGIRAFHQGRYAEAKKLLSSFPSDSHAQTFLALATAASGGCRQAERSLTQQFESNGDAELRRLCGLALTQCLIARKDFAGAAPVIARLEREFPKDADVLYESARLHMRAWNDAVLRMYQNAPASFRVNQLSAEIFETQGRYGEAVAEYRKAIAKNPDALNLHFRLGRALLLESHAPAALEAAQKEFEAELRLNPADAAAEYEIGQILTARDRLSEASEHFARAVELSPDFPEALVALAKTHVRAGRYSDAIALLERAVRLQPDMESAHYTLMLVYRNTGDAQKALKEKAELDRLQKPPEGEFSEFLKKLGEKPAEKP
ncbi:MAG TPA: tetratricopeptide repeat protein [Bryobacteraceae bacterium]|jgi:tetratricopeptide (TPR) repeat protein|nr:tetratricopeptide repeat protein [Bryobacteraceae bacterium]